GSSPSLFDRYTSRSKPSSLLASSSRQRCFTNRSFSFSLKAVYFAGALGVATAADCGWLSMYMTRAESFLVGLGFAVAAPLSSYIYNTATVLPPQEGLNFDARMAFSTGGVSSAGAVPHAEITFKSSLSTAPWGFNEIHAHAVPSTRRCSAV